jgi:predicted dehydrogenase
MDRPTAARVGFIGLGMMARGHLRDILDHSDSSVVAICEPSESAFAAGERIFRERGLDVPPNVPDWTRFVARFADQLDAVVIVTPHVLHHEQATACMEAGLDVILEKPMVMTAAEAESLIATRDRTGRTLMVAFQGTLSRRGGEARRLLRSGELGPILNISAVVWQDWATNTAGSWRQQPDASGGGFLFDTGAHMLNTVTDLAGEDFAEVAAWQADDGYPVDIRSVVMGRLASGALVTMNACGNAIPSCDSDVRFFTTRAILRTGIYGDLLELQRAGRRQLRRVPMDSDASVWGRFLEVRAGATPNPNPPEVGLRMARLWDAIRLSAQNGGAVVTLGSAVPIRSVGPDGILPNPTLTVAAS